MVANSAANALNNFSMRHHNSPRTVSVTSTHSEVDTTNSDVMRSIGATAMTPSSASTQRNVNNGPTSSDGHHQSSCSSSSGPNGGNDENDSCYICFEKPIDTALYNCGHLCLCLECAYRLWRGGDGHCPLCRAVIRDVIRIYRP